MSWYSNVCMIVCAYLCWGKNRHNFRLFQPSKLATTLCWAGLHWVQLLFFSIYSTKGYTATSLSWALSSSFVLELPAVEIGSVRQWPNPQQTSIILTWSHHCIVVGLHPDSGCMMCRLHFTCLYIVQQESCSVCVFLCEYWVFFVKNKLYFFSRFVIFICLILFTILCHVDLGCYFFVLIRP